MARGLVRSLKERWATDKDIKDAEEVVKILEAAQAKK
jgi:hypothetical protein